MLLLTLSEVSDYFASSSKDRMVVDKVFDEKLSINVDISFLSLNCRGKPPFLCMVWVLHVSWLSSIMPSRLDLRSHWVCQRVISPSPPPISLPHLALPDCVLHFSFLVVSSPPISFRTALS